jgi:UDP-GlcNAc:undecaprenyl-phosphate/decaprenyl-phosphate GlcNAc-1-phosphate transferase
MISQVDISSLSIPLWLLAVLGLLMAFAISYLAIPLIYRTAWINGLFAGINGRTSHLHPVPLFGGVAVFTAFILTTISIAGSYFEPGFIYSIAGMLIMFIAGIKDDLTISKPTKKLLGQILSTLYIIVFADIRITSLHEFLGVTGIPYIASIVLTMFVLIVIINGFNLIDGIDGLASGVGILISAVLGLWFFLTSNFLYTIMSFSLAGALIAFFYFNVFSKKFKLFLGDGGSLIIGLLLGILVVRFIQLEPYAEGIAVVRSTPAVAIGLFVIPLFDTLRVYSIRIMQGRSPFHADRQHIHHCLLQLGFSHLKITLILLSVNMFFIAFSLALQGIGTLLLTALLFGLACLMSYILKILIRERAKKVLHSENVFVRIKGIKNKKRRIIREQTIRNILLHPEMK